MCMKRLTLSLLNRNNLCSLKLKRQRRSTTTIIGTSQTSFHDTLSWVRSTVWKQAVEVKRIGHEFASSTESSSTDFKQKLETLKTTTLEQVNVEIEKTKKSASVFHLTDHESSATIAVGKKFEGVDYTKTTCGGSIESTKVSVGILMEETRVNIQHMFGQMTHAVCERRKQGGENVQADVEVIIKNSRQEIDTYISKSKSEFEKKLTSSTTTTEVSSVNKVEVDLSTETIKKVHQTLTQIQESYLVQVTRVEEITVSSTVVSEEEYTEKIAVISYETKEKLNATLSVSETVIGHHIEIIAESSKVEQSTSTDSKKSTDVSLGVEYGLLVVAETTKNVSSQISTLVESVHHRITLNTEHADQDVTQYVETSEKSLDLIFDQAKEKITHELSMVASHEKVEEEHFLASLEALRISSKKRITEIHTVATSHKEETKVVSSKLLQIAEESRHEITSHYESAKKIVTKQAEKITQIGQVSHESTTFAGNCY